MLKANHTLLSISRLYGRFHCTMTHFAAPASVMAKPPRRKEKGAGIRFHYYASGQFACDATKGAPLLITIVRSHPPVQQRGT